MARVNVYLPDELAAGAKSAGLNISGLVQETLRRELAKRDMHRWLQEVRRLPKPDVTHEQVLEALDAARDELGNWE